MSLENQYNILRKVVEFYANEKHWTEKHPELDMTVIEIEGYNQPALKALEQADAGPGDIDA